MNLRIIWERIRKIKYYICHANSPQARLYWCGRLDEAERILKELKKRA